MAKKNYYILLSKNGYPIITDHKLPIYWNRDVAIKDRERFKAYCMTALSVEKLYNLLNYKKARSDFNNQGKLKNWRMKNKKYYYDIYYDRGGGDVFMQTIRENSYKEAKRILLDIHKGMSIKISHYERTTAQ